MTSKSSLVIVGLGPGDAALLTGEARDVLASAPEVWLRTSRHPTVPGLPAGPAYHSFDEIYEREPTFDAIYEAIVARVLELAARPAGVVYAVPGHPLFGEATVRALLLRAPEAGISMRIVAGISFIDTISIAIDIDPLDDGLLILDALSLDARGRRLVPQRPTVIAQVYDRRAASQAKLALLERYPADHPARIVRASGGANAGTIETTVARLDHHDVFDHLVSLYLPPLAPDDDTRSFEGLRAVVARLRSPDGGCPWDLEQTHETLKRYLVEEAYEALDALDGGDSDKIAEELGDLLMQVMLHAQVAEDDDEFVIEDVLESIAEKLIRRHPHVFGDVSVADAHDVVRNWDALKQQERGDTPLLDAVPNSMPALAQAQSVFGRAMKAGFAPQIPTPAEAITLLDSLAAGDGDAATLGALLAGIVALARERGLDAEDSLRTAVQRYRAEVASREQVSRSG